VNAVWAHVKQNFTENDPVYKLWCKYNVDARACASRVYDENITSERQLKGYVPLITIERVRDSLKPWSPQRLLLGMYTHISPVRNDFHRLSVTPTPAAGNYLVLADKKLVLQEYKTSKRYGRIEIDLPDALVADIQSSLRKYPREWLFVQKNGEPYTSENSFSKWANDNLKSVLGNKYVTLTILRHVYIMDRAVGAPGIERKRIARTMGHSVNMQLGYELSM
jgi:hypothetical protein